MPCAVVAQYEPGIEQSVESLQGCAQPAVGTFAPHTPISLPSTVTAGEKAVHVSPPGQDEEETSHSRVHFPGEPTQVS
jgi:hypothetical protein